MIGKITQIWLKSCNLFDKEVNRYYTEINSINKNNKIVKDDQSKHKNTNVIMSLEYYISRL